MANKKGIITRKDIIENEALEFGITYAENVEKAISANNKLIGTVKIMNGLVKDFQNAKTQKEYIEAKNAQSLATQKAIDLIKQEEAAEKSALKIKEQQIKLLITERKEQDQVANSERKAQKEKEKSIKLTLEERVQLELKNRAEKQAILAKLNLTEAYTKLSNERTRAKNVLRDLIASESASTAEIKKAQKEFQVLDQRVRKADAAVGDFTKNVGNYPTFGKFIGGIKGIFNAFGFAGGLGATVSLIKDAYKTIKDFEQGVADLISITGASGKDLDYLKNKAIDLGKGTKGGAIAVVEAYKLIASAKPELLENVSNLNQVTEATIRLSKASGLELPEAATKLTDAMNQFGAPASEASKYVDVLAAGAKYGAAEIPGLTDAILEFGSVAKVSNIDIKESVGLVELLAEKGIKGAQAGTAIKNIMLEVNSGFTTKEARAELDKYGISWEKLKDKTIPFSDKLEMLKPLLSDTNSIVNTFKKENSAAAISLIENTNRLKELTSKVGEFGVAEEQASIRTNTLTGDTDRMTSTYDSLILSIGKGSGVITNFFRFFVKGANETLEKLIRINSTWNEIYEKAADKGKELGNAEFEKRIMSAGFITSTDAEKAMMVLKTAELEYNELLKRKKKSNDELANFNPYAINFGKSGKTLKKEQEQLILDLKARETIIKRAKERLNQLNNDKGSESKSATPIPEGESDADRKAREAAEKKARQDYLSKLKKFEDDAYALEKFRLERTIELNLEIVNDEKKSIDDRLEAFYVAESKKRELAESTLKHEIVQNALSKVDVENTSKAQIDVIKKSAENKANLLIKGVELSKNATNEEKLVYEKFLKEKEDLERKSQENKQKLIDNAAEVERKKVEKVLQEQDTQLNKQLEFENIRFQETLSSYKTFEDALKEHENNKLEIIKDFAKKSIQENIDTIKTILDAQKLLPEDKRISNDLIKKYEHDLAVFQKQLSDQNVTTKTDELKEIEDANKRQSEQLKEIAKQTASALIDLTNTIFDRRIQTIDVEIDKNNEYYDKQIELAGNDERQKDLYQQQRDKKNAELEKKKREEQRKQAIFNKAMQATQVSLSTIGAVMTALRDVPKVDFGVSAGLLAASYGVLGAIQLAAVLATPIPKYKDGRKGGPKEIAMINDGGVTEVVERKTGEIQTYSGYNRIVQLFEGDTVHKSVDDYNKLQRAAVMASIDTQGRKMSDFQASQTFNSAYDKEMLKELKETRKAIQNQKNSTTVNVPKFDINHHLWKMKNTNWN